MQTADLVRPQGHGDSTPFGENRRMMAFLFRERAYPIGKGERFGKIGDAKNPFKALDILALDHRPLRNLGLELLDLGFGHAR